MDRDNMFTFMDAWLSAAEGEDPSKAIERQEQRGQAKVVRLQQLPRKLNDHSIPNQVLFLGVSDDMDYDTRKKITSTNVETYTKLQYENMGIEIINEADDLFWNVKLPEGWEIKATDHTMWNDLIDNKGRKRANFFYKAAFYDRSAFTNLKTRFSMEVTHISDSEDYDVWRKSDIQGQVKDCNNIIYCTECVPATDDYLEENKINKELREKLESFMTEHYPNYKDVHAYWD